MACKKPALVAFIIYAAVNVCWEMCVFKVRLLGRLTCSHYTNRIMPTEVDRLLRTSSNALRFLLIYLFHLQ